MNHHHPKRPMMRPLGCLVVFAALLILPCFFLVEMYNTVAYRPAGMFGKLMITVAWFLASYSLLRILFIIRLRNRERQGIVRPPNILEEAMDALDQIASGDYDVHVEPGDHFHNFNELADKINKLARDLSSVEGMRQEFISNVSHEIQSPLTSISGFAALLKKEDLTREQQLHYIQVIEAESTRLSKLSDNLLKLSALESQQEPPVQAPFRLDRQLEDVLLMLEPQWTEGNLELDISLEQVTLLGERDMLSQVWINLIHNSIKFTPPGGTISVSLKQEQDKAVCTIADTGAGIPEESLVRIFERFYKVDKSRDRSLGGNGLGLSLVKKIVDRHGGKINVQSQVDQGTTFAITLPGAQDEA